MTSVAGKTISVIGAFSAFPRRLVAREVAARGGRLRNSVTRQTSIVALGRRLLWRTGHGEIEKRIASERENGKVLLGENALLRMLRLRQAPPQASISRASMLEQSGLAERDFDLLSLFDAFEHDCEPFSFRDLILSKKYGELIRGGAPWAAVARSVHRSSDGVGALAALSLQADGKDAVRARVGEGLSELDGQMLLPIGRPDDTEFEALFGQAEEAEAAGRFADAETLFERCQAIEGNDPDCAFNRANCLAKMGSLEAARVSYLRALKLDGKFVEAWFNLADLLRQQGQIESARMHLQRAIAIDAEYGDAVYNLASLEFSQGNLAEARRWWARYLELDAESDWARNAQRGLQYVDLQLSRNAG